MSISLYDESLVNKIKSWTKDNTLTIIGPDENKRLLAYQADITNDKPINLPLISIRRARSVDIKNINKNTMSFSGKKLYGHHELDDLPPGEAGCRLMLLNSIPIGIGYQIDIYTRYMEEAQEYLRNLVYNIINYPKLLIEIPYNDAKYSHTCTMQIVNTLEDNSDINERLSPGQFTRWSIGLRIEDAYLFSVPIKKTYHMDIPEVETTSADIQNK